MDNFMNVLLKIANELGKQKMPDLTCLDVERIAFECRWYFNVNRTLPEFIDAFNKKDPKYTGGLWILLTTGTYILMK